MFKWIFLAQAVVYLLLMPGMRSGFELGYHPPLGASLLAIFSFIGGILLTHLRLRHVESRYEGMAQLRPTPALTLLMPTLAGLYAISAVVFGLINRRQGSEFMAELYSDLPLLVLGIIRGYEIIFVPVALVYVFSGSTNKIGQWAVITALILSLPFMGVADSRGRLLVLAIYMLCFVRPATFINFLYSNVRFLVAAVVVVGAFLFFSFKRSAAYTSLNEYLIVEVYQRLDGLNLATDLQDAGFLTNIGQFDFKMFYPLISKIPFLEAARTAKLLGLTSTKQYYLHDLLGSGKIDASNSMLVDALYFGGLAGVIISFLFIGYAVSQTDRFVANGGLFKDLNRSVIALAFVTSFALIENDLMGSVITFAQNYILIALVLRFGTTWHQSAETPPSPLSESFNAAREAR